MTGVVIPRGTEACRCCDGIAASTPQGLFNRPGLSAIAYRVGEYAQFNASLLAALSSSDAPALARLLTRDGDDFTIGLFDAFACAADVLTFYQERIANESYLRTATERVSLQELARLIGYRLRPGVAAETWLAFALETPKTPPPNLPPEPGAFVTGIPAALVLAAGLQVQSVPGPGETPQTFETVEGLHARPEWNAIRASRDELHTPARGDTVTWLKGVTLNLKPGDALVFAGPDFLQAPADNNRWDLRLIDRVTLDAAANRTGVAWKRGLGSIVPRSDPAAAPQVYVLRRRAALFGHNAPMFLSLNDEFRRDYPGTNENSTEWPAFTPSPAGATDRAGHVDLDAVAAEVTSGSLVALAKGEFNRPDEAFPTGTYVELYKVTGSTEVSRAEFALSAKVTRLALAGQNLLSQFFGTGVLRQTSVYVQSEALTLAPQPIAAPVSGDRLPLAVAADGLSAGRRLIVKGTKEVPGKGGADGALVHQATVTAVVAAGAGGAIVTITPPLPFALARDSIVVFANVALATHGETATQVLGAGDASRPFQRFELKRLPLTYRSAANEVGAASELALRIGDVEWTEKPTLFGAAPAERAYALSTDEQGKLYVGFGDGEHGARLPSGVNNVRARYRQGLGNAGNVGADKLTQLVTRPPGLKSVANAVAASGGTDPEPADQARRTMTLGTRTLGRAVSLLDYEDFALAFTGIAKAQARMLHLPGGVVIAVTIAGQDGRPLAATNPVRANLLAALKASGDPHVDVVLLDFAPRSFRLALKVKRAPDYAIEPVLANVAAALRAHFAFEARALAQPVQQSDVIATVHAVPGVLAVDLDALHLDGAVPSLQTRLLAAQMRVGGGVPLAAELLTLAGGPLDRLEEFA
jgi:hypothetical protein